MHLQLGNMAHQQADFCRIFSSPTRILILWALQEKEMSVGAIAEAVGASLQNVSQHLGVMKERQVVTSRREGQTIYYRIDWTTLESQCSRLLQTNASRVNPYQLKPAELDTSERI